RAAGDPRPLLRGRGEPAALRLLRGREPRGPRDRDRSRRRRRAGCIAPFPGCGPRGGRTPRGGARRRERHVEGGGGADLDPVRPARDGRGRDRRPPPNIGAVVARSPGGGRAGGRHGDTVEVVTDARSARVLVVEDDATISEVVVRYLEREG